MAPTPMPLGVAPYVDPVTLQNAPTGIDWSTIPATPSYDPAAQNSEIWNMCMRATDTANGYCNQVLQATIDNQLLHGPDFYVTVGPGGGGGSPTPYWGTTGANARMIMERWPILSVNNVQYCANNVWPRQWQTVPTGYYEPENPPIGVYGTAAPNSSAQGGQAILVAPGYVNWNLGRNGFAIQVNYTNGWPHGILTQDATVGSTSLTVNDTTGWAISNYFGTTTGATGIIKDGGQQEVVQCASASTTSGPGILYLNNALTYEHEQGIVVTTMPASIEKACIYFAAAEALTRGATSTSIHSIGGTSESTEMSAAALNATAELLLHPFRRTI